MYGEVIARIRSCCRLTRVPTSVVPRRAEKKKKKGATVIKSFKSDLITRFRERAMRDEAVAPDDARRYVNEHERDGRRKEKPGAK